MPAGARATAPLALLLGLLHSQAVAAVFTGDCYAGGIGGWDLVYWGDPGVRLPEGGVLKLCGTADPAVFPPGSANFRWTSPQGVCRILGDAPDQCPAEFSEATCQTLIESAPSNPTGTLWPTADDYDNGLIEQPGTYWLTSPTPGACESGVKLQVQIVAPSPPSSSGSSSSGAQQRARWALQAATAALAAALLLAG